MNTKTERDPLRPVAALILFVLLFWCTLFAYALQQNVMAQSTGADALTKASQKVQAEEDAKNQMLMIKEYPKTRAKPTAAELERQKTLKGIQDTVKETDSEPVKVRTRTSREVSKEVQKSLLGE